MTIVTSKLVNASQHKLNWFAARNMINRCQTGNPRPATAQRGTGEHVVCNKVAYRHMGRRIHDH